MDNIKNAIVRVGKRVRAFEKLRERRFKETTFIPSRSSSFEDGVVQRKKEQKVEQSDHMNLKLTQELMQRSNPILKNYDRKKFQEFLQPLNMKNLKILNDTSKSYDKTLSKRNWQIKNSNNNLVLYNTFLDNQNLFNKMLDLLIELTPETLMGERPEFTQIAILQSYEDYTKSLRYDIPKFYYHEIPKLDPHMTVAQFDEYIYFLTHSRILYKNSSSLNGIVNDILLYTHKLDNADFKHKRTVNTYNNLIKYYGHDKNQSIFARTLLMVMEKDHILPNIETINNLLKAVTITSQIRSNSNAFQLVIKYLKLAKFYGLQVNLLTWKRVYDCINNLYLKEMFLNKLSLINLPITKDITYKIIDDYMKIADREQDMIKFIQTDLNLYSWRNDNKIVNKVNWFKLVHSKQPQTLINDLFNHQNPYSLKYICEGLIGNAYLPEDTKINLILSAYQKYHQHLPRDSHPIIIRIIVNELSRINYDIKGANQVVSKLVYEFRKLSGTEDIQENIDMMKSLTSSFNILLTKFRHFNLPIVPEDIQSLRIDSKKVYKIPNRVANNIYYTKIKSINKSKLLNYNTNLADRLQKRRMIT